MGILQKKGCGSQREGGCHAEKRKEKGILQKIKTSFGPGTMETLRRAAKIIRCKAKQSYIFNNQPMSFPWMFRIAPAGSLSTLRS